MKELKQKNNNQIELFFNIAPVGKGRPRRGKNGIFYTPKQTKDFEKFISKSAQSQLESLHMLKPLDGPVFLDVIFLLPIPKSFTGKRRRECESGLKLPLVSPDIDNLAKSLLDGLNGILYHDDKQVVQLCLRKIYSKGNGGISLCVGSFWF